MKKLSKSAIIVLNEESIINDGGNFMPPNNLLNESNLDYLIDIVDSEMFGEPLYPEISDKAAVYFFSVICNHIFSDGNKRTGLAAALVYLEAHNFQLKDEITEEILLNFVIKVASGESTLDECRAWFKENITPI
jgi:death on curing protein